MHKKTSNESNDSKYKTLLSLAEKEYNKMKLNSHNWGHILRVLDNCNKLNVNNQLNKDIIFPAIVLHDLGRKNKKESNHSESTAQAEKILAKTGYNKQLISEIIDCIKSHSTESKNQPKSIEAITLFDADKLDSYGTIGIARFFTLAGEQNWGLEQASNKAFERITQLNKIDGFYTKEAEKIGKTKAKTAFIFYYLLFKELKEKEKNESLKKILTKKYGNLKTTILIKTLEKITD